MDNESGFGIVFIACLLVFAIMVTNWGFAFCLAVIGIAIAFAIRMGCGEETAYACVFLLVTAEFVIGII